MAQGYYQVQVSRIPAVSRYELQIAQLVAASSWETNKTRVQWQLPSAWQV